MLEETLKDIRKRCRMAMNGVASASMRGYGLNYKLNFGVSIQKIKEIAQRYTSSQELAERLWLDGTRELKILATLLYPLDAFGSETANRWVEQIPNQEIREQLCINLLQNVSFADSAALTWANNADENVRTTGYWLLVRRLMMKTFAETLHLDTLAYVWNDLSTENVSLRNAATLFLKNAGKTDQVLSQQIVEKVSVYKDSPNAVLKEIYDGLKFEFEFFYEAR